MVGRKEYFVTWSRAFMSLLDSIAIVCSATVTKPFRASLALALCSNLCKLASPEELRILTLASCQQWLNNPLLLLLGLVIGSKLMKKACTTFATYHDNLTLPVSREVSYMERVSGECPGVL